MPMLLAGRRIAGVGVAGTTTVVRVILSDSTSLSSNNWQTGIMFILYSVGPYRYLSCLCSVSPLMRGLSSPGFSIGPVIGGLLTDVNWRWVFGFQLPIGAVSMVLVCFSLRNHVKKAQPPRHAPITATGGSQTSLLNSLSRIDWLGGTLFVAGGILILMALSWGSTSEWKTARVIVCFCVGGALLVVFVSWQAVLGNWARAQTTWTDPMIPLEIFKNYDVCATFFAAFTSGMVKIFMLYHVKLHLGGLTLELPLRSCSLCKEFNLSIGIKH
jgi:Fungal trichothecene efflux pump (TRI12)